MHSGLSISAIFFYSVVARQLHCGKHMQDKRTIGETRCWEVNEQQQQQCFWRERASLICICTHKWHCALYVSADLTATYFLLQ